MLLVRKTGETSWSLPNVTAYEDEAALQTLLEQSPDLLPGNHGAPVVVARELTVPLGAGIDGAVDLIAVDAAGEITLVECKLRANPEIRRQVVGQIFAYAAGLWGLFYEEFDRRFTAQARASLTQRMAGLHPDGWDEEAFREQVSEHLAAGRFRLVIAVDEITDELKGIVRYLNRHSGPALQVLALELRYVAHGYVEILVPTVYGKESSEDKDTTPPPWNERLFFAKLAEWCSPAGWEGARRLYQFAKARASVVTWGRGKDPSGTVALPLAGRSVRLLNLYAWAPGKANVYIYFTSLADAVPRDAVQRFADRLRAIPGVAERLIDLEGADYRKDPPIPIDPILAQPDAVATIEHALEELRSSTEHS